MNFPTPTRHGNWAIVNGQLVDLDAAPLSETGEALPPLPDSAYPPGATPLAPRPPRRSRRAAPAQESTDSEPTDPTESGDSTDLTET